jgi:hypothetical protein
MLLSGKPKPPIVIVPLLAGAGVGDPQAVANIATKAIAPSHEPMIRLRFMSAPSQGLRMIFPDRTPSQRTFFHLGGFHDDSLVRWVPEQA